MSTPPPGRLQEPSTTPPAPPTAAGTERLGWLRLLRERGFRRLLAVRFAAQWGDGMFQAALGGAVLFNPEREADPLAVAAGLAVILLPYSLVGPFAGALLDRWDRRRVLLVANCLRAVLTLVVAVIVFAGVAGAPLYLAALTVAGVSRFVLAGLSAALPHVVARRHLVEANVVAATAGAGVAALGGATAIGARALLGAGDAGSALTTAVAAVGSVLAAVLAAGFAARLLGPDRTDEPDRTLVAVAHGLVGRGPGHRAHTDGRGVVPRAGRTPAGVRRVDAAHADAVPAHVHRHGGAARRDGRRGGSGRADRGRARRRRTAHPVAGAPAGAAVDGADRAARGRRAPSWRSRRGWRSPPCSGRRSCSAPRGRW